MVILRIVLLIFGIALPVTVAEGYLRVSKAIPSDQLLPYEYHYADLRRIIAGDAYVSFDRDLGWVPTAASTRRQDGVNYIANRSGLRADREYATAPEAGVRRIAAFGDSYTYCENVDNRDCWVARLETAWPGTETMNFGVPAYGPDQAWLRYQREPLGKTSCAVLIGYMTENTNRVVNRFRPFYKPPDGFVMSKPRFLLHGDGLAVLPNPVSEPSELLDPKWAESTLGPNDRWYFPGVFVPSPLDGLQSVRVARTAAYRYKREGEINFQSDLARQVEEPYRTQDESFQVAGRVLIGFYREVARSGATPIVIIFGQKSDIETLAAGGSKTYQPLVDWLAREQIPVIDVTDDLAREARRSGIRSVIANHYRPQGNEIVTRKLARELPSLVAPTCG